MKHAVWGTCMIAAWTTPAFAQTPADYDRTDSEAAKEFVEDNPDEILLIPPPSSTYEEFIVAGTRVGYLDKDLLTVPATILTEAELQARSQAYISDLLRSIAGISVSSSGPASGLTQIRMRGTEANHVLVIVDGVQIDNPDGEFDFSGLRAEDIVRIEILRGEQSALYGSDAVGGVINIITRAGTTRKGWRGSVEVGSRNTLEGQVSAVIPISGASLSINGNAFTTEGYDISGLEAERDGSRSESLNIGLNTIEVGGVTFGGKFGTSRRVTEFDGDPDFDGRLNNTDSDTTVNTRTGRFDARFGLAGFDHLFTLFLLDNKTSIKAGFSSLSTGKRTNLSWGAKKEFGDHALTLLTETEREQYGIMPSSAISPVSAKNTTYAIAADYLYDGVRVTLSASARYDFNDLFRNATTWRVGAGYKFDWDGRLRGSIGTGVKNPSLIELFGFFPESNFVGNPDLKPENALGFSLGYDQEFGDLDVSIDYFRSGLENEIFTDFSSFPFLPRNRMSDSTREGVELEMRWQPNAYFNARASTTFVDAFEDGVKEIRRPEFLATATATWTPVDKISLTLSADHTGAQIDTDFATFSPVELDAFTLVGLNMQYAVDENLTLSMRGENLLNEDYEEIIGYTAPERGIYAGINADF